MFICQNAEGYMVRERLATPVPATSISSVSTTFCSFIIHVNLYIKKVLELIFLKLTLNEEEMG